MMFRIFKVLVGCRREYTAARKWKEEPHLRDAWVSMDHIGWTMIKSKRELPVRRRASESTFEETVIALLPEQISC